MYIVCQLLCHRRNCYDLFYLHHIEIHQSCMFVFFFLGQRHKAILCKFQLQRYTNKMTLAYKSAIFYEF